jgi:hypothetical protein
MGSLRSRSALATIALLGIGFVPVQAQPPGPLGPPPLTPSTRPVTSPYLDLAVAGSGNRSAAYQYFRQVRPELELRRANARLGYEIEDVRRTMGQPLSMAQSPTSTIGATGHRTGFQSFGSFFPSRRR